MTEVLLNRLCATQYEQTDSYYPGKAFDGSTGSYGQTAAWCAYWSSAYQVTGYVGKQYPVGHALTKVRVYTFANNASAKNFTIQGSNDGSSWTTLHTVTNAPWATQWNDYSFSNTTAYTYWKVDVTANWGGSYACIGELEFYATDGFIPVHWDIQSIGCAFSDTNGLRITKSSSADALAQSDKKVTTGKWYFEVYLNAGSYFVIGCCNTVYIYPGNTSDSWGYLTSDGSKINNGTLTAYGSSLTAGDTLGIAFDLDNGKIFFAKNNTWQNSGNPVTGANPAFTGVSGNIFPAMSITTLSNSATGKFSKTAFLYTPPTGFNSLQEESYSHTGSGGAIAGGSADIVSSIARSAVFTPTGGGVAGGSADVVQTLLQQYIHSSMGGAVASGSATVVAAPVLPFHIGIPAFDGWQYTAGLDAVFHMPHPLFSGSNKICAKFNLPIPSFTATANIKGDFNCVLKKFIPSFSGDKERNNTLSPILMRFTPAFHGDKETRGNFEGVFNIGVPSFEGEVDTYNAIFNGVFPMPKPLFSNATDHDYGILRYQKGQIR